VTLFPRDSNTVALELRCLLLIVGGPGFLDILTVKAASEHELSAAIERKARDFIVGEVCERFQYVANGEKLLGLEVSWG
jgi:hypothetical protein